MAQCREFCSYCVWAWSASRVSSRVAMCLWLPPPVECSAAPRIAVFHSSHFQWNEFWWIHLTGCCFQLYCFPSCLFLGVRTRWSRLAMGHWCEDLWQGWSLYFLPLSTFVVRFRNVPETVWRFLVWFNARVLAITSTEQVDCLMSFCVWLRYLLVEGSVERVESSTMPDRARGTDGKLLQTKIPPKFTGTWFSEDWSYYCDTQAFVVRYRCEDPLPQANDLSGRFTTPDSYLHVDGEAELYLADLYTDDSRKKIPCLKTKLTASKQACRRPDIVFSPSMTDLFYFAFGRFSASVAGKGFSNALLRRNAEMS